MALLRQMFDDCTLNGLKHAWQTFTLETKDPRITHINSGCSYQGEVPTYGGPDPFGERKISHARRCQNCTKSEEFVINSSGNWEERKEPK